MLVFGLGLFICAILILSTEYEYVECERRRFQAYYSFGKSCCVDEDIGWIKLVYGVPFLIAALLSCIGSGFSMPLGFKMENNCLLIAAASLMTAVAIIAGICGFFSVGYGRQVTGACDIGPGGGFIHDELYDNYHHTCYINARLLCDLIGPVVGGGWVAVEITVFASIAYCCGFSALCCCTERWSEARGLPSTSTMIGTPAVIGQPVQSMGQPIAAPQTVAAPTPGKPVQAWTNEIE